ncbi:MAG: winged helix-turn-helix domain-containing protein [Myxococcota bacterium]
MTGTRPVLAVGQSQLDLARGELTGPHPPVSLSELETSLLAYLARRPGAVVPKAELRREVWGYSDTVSSRAVDATLVRARKKLGKAGIGLDSAYGRGLSLRVVEPVSGPTPADDSGLIGRASELATLRGRLDRAGLTCVWGPPGVGKTSLVNALGGIVLQAEGARALDQELAGHLACTVPGLRTGLKRCRRAIVVDELENRGPDVLDRCRRWAADAHVVVVSTARLPADTDLRVEPLRPGDARDLLRTLVDIEVSEAEALTARIDRLPREIELLARAIEVLGTRRMAQLTEGSFPVLEQAVEALWADLSPGEAELLAAASLFADSFDAQGLAAVLERRPAEVDRTARLLWTRSLLQGERDRFRLLKPVRAVAVRARPAGTDALEARLHAWLAGLLAEEVRWHHHFDDLTAALPRATPRQLLPMGLSLILHSFWARDPLPAFAALQATRAQEGLALKVLLLAISAELDKVASDLHLLRQEAADPTTELARRAALLLVEGGDAGEALAPWRGDAYRLEVVALVSIAASAGRIQEVDLLEGLATECERSDPSNACALYTWAARAARLQGLDRWVSLARRGGTVTRVAVELRLGDSGRALQAALDLDDPFPTIEDGLRALVAAGRGDVALAQTFLDRHPERSVPATAYLDVARNLLGDPVPLARASDAALVEAWRAGTLDPTDDPVSDTKLVMHWALRQRAPEP